MSNNAIQQPLTLEAIQIIKEKLKTINLIPAIVRGYDEKFINSPYIIGSSEIPFGLRSIVISKREGLELAFKNELLSGKIFHRGIQKTSVMYEMTKDINEALGYTEKEVNGKRYLKKEEKGNYREFEVLSEYQYSKRNPKNQYVEIIPCRFLSKEDDEEICTNPNIEDKNCEGCEFKEPRYFRLHPDIWTSMYCIEIKSTGMPKFKWGEMAPYHLMQLNAGLGFRGHAFGFVLKVDLGAMEGNDRHGGYFKSKSKIFSNLWNRYFTLFYHPFSQELFDYTLEKANIYFDYIDNNTDIKEIPCPEHIFKCDNECSLHCPNPIEKVKMDVNEECECCNTPIEMTTWGLIRNDKTYHYTNEKGHPFEACVQKCKDAWRVKENEN